MRNNMTSNTQREFVRITAISDRNAQCVTAYNAQVVVEWKMNLPSPMPQIGEWWVIERGDAQEWTFISRVTSGSYNAMYYSVLLNASSCVGRERPVIDDISKIGLTNVYLVVAEDGQVYWDSSAARAMGYIVQGDRIEQTIRRLQNYGIGIVFVIDCDSIPSYSNDYAQKPYGAAIENRSRISFPTAKNLLGAMVGELYERYGDVANGVCFINFGLLDPTDTAIYDASVATEAAYVSMYGELPPYDILLHRSADGWYEDEEKWQAMWNWQYEKLLQAIREYGIGDWPISAIVPSNTLLRPNSLQRTGKLSTGIDGSFGNLGWSMVGVPLDYTLQQDEAAEMRSLEFAIAMTNRLAGDAAPIYQLDVSTIFQPDGVFEMLAKYNATNVLLSSYEKWRTLSDQSVIDITSAMNSYSVVEKSTLDDVGLMLSSAAKDARYTSVSMNHRWFDAVENIASAMLDNLPHKLRILYDADIENGTNLDGLSAIVAMTPSMLNEDVVEGLQKLFARKDINIVLAGIPMMRDGTYALLDNFKQGAVDQTVYFDVIEIDEDGFSVGKEYFYIENGVGITGVLPALTKGSAHCKRGFNIISAQRGLAPIFFDGRTSVVAMDITSSTVLQNLIGRLVIYAIGRDGVVS